MSSSEREVPGAAGGIKSDEQTGRQLLSEHPALVMTLGYLIVSLLGLSYQWTLFRRFDVNFILYAEVTDFLMGAFRAPITFALSLSALLVAWLGHLYNDWEARWWRRNPPRRWFSKGYHRLVVVKFSRYSPAVFFVTYSVMFIWIYAENRAEEIKDGKGEQVRVEMAAGQASTADPSLILGASSRFLFVYRPDAAVIEVIPHESIARILVSGSTASGT